MDNILSAHALALPPLLGIQREPKYMARTRVFGPGQHIGRFSGDLLDCVDHLLRCHVMDHVPNPVQDLQRAMRNRPSQLVRLFGTITLSPSPVMIATGIMGDLKLENGEAITGVGPLGT